MAKIATLQEVESHWSIDDLMDAHEAMDIELEYMNRETQLAKQGRESK